MMMRSARLLQNLRLGRRFSSGAAISSSTTAAEVRATHRTPLESYEDLIRLGDISEDPHQMEAVRKLQSLHDQIILIDSSLNEAKMARSNNQSSWFSSLFSSAKDVATVQPSQNADNIKGLYMYGGTGCGKTFIMDLFYEVIPIKRKKRVHFNNFMIDIHKRLHRLKSKTAGSSKAVGDSIMEQITNELMDEAYLLCFDEFQVTDIADAMILKSLFESMLAKGAIVVATSNRPPLDLYKNGLQRSLFLPFIKTLNDSTNVHSLMESSRDYRILKSTNQALNMYLSPLTEEAEKVLNAQFRRLSVSITPDVQQPQRLEGVLPPGSRFPPLHIQLSVLGHLVNIPEAVAGRRIARFTFKELCDEALGAADYIHLAETFRSVFITGVPILNLDSRNEMRRFITLIDALYEESVQVVVLADEIPTKLLRLTAKERGSPHDEVFAFDRTVSRLLEMQSESYLTACTTRYPVEAGGSDWLYRELASLKTSASEPLWKQYNWGRNSEFPMPVSCLQVLLSDLITVKKMELANEEIDLLLDVEHTIENITEKLLTMVEQQIEFEEFASLLFHR